MIKTIYSSIGIIFSLIFITSCNNNEIDNGKLNNELAITAPAVKLPEKENPLEKESQIVTELNTTYLPTKKTSWIQQRKIVKDSLNELKAEYSINDAVIDSLNAIHEIYDKEIYNHIAISYFSGLADSLHGKSYFADNSDEVMLSVMNILTTRLTEGLDLVFLIDKTGSMDDDIDKVKNSLELIMENISRFKNVKVGMAFYGDKNYHYDLWYNKINLTTNIDDIKQFMETYSTIGNPDVAESVNDGIVKIVEEMNWTPGNKRMMLVIGDAQSQIPPYSNYNSTQVIKKCDSMHVKFNLYPVIISSKQKDIETINHTVNFANVFPNPANEYCNIKIKNSSEMNYYEIKDMTGRDILSSNTMNSEITIPLQNIPSGSYLIQVFNRDLTKFYSKPLIVQH